MRTKTTAFSLLLILSLLLNLFFSPTATVLAAGLPVVDDFESGLPTGTDPNGVDVGFVTFQGNNSSVAISTTSSPPVPVPGAGVPNNVLKMDVNVVTYAGFVHNFSHVGVNAWVPQDWSAYEGFSFWLYGNSSGTTMFVDVLDNRNPGSTRDDAERWSITLPCRRRGLTPTTRKWRSAWRKPWSLFVEALQKVLEPEFDLVASVADGRALLDAAPG